MKRKLVAGLVLITALALAGCGSKAENNETVEIPSAVSIESEGAESTEASKEEASSEAQEGEQKESEEASSEAAQPEAKKEPTDVQKDTVMLGDIDGDGVEEYVVTEYSNDGYWNEEDVLRWTLYFDDEEIYQGYHVLFCDFDAEFVDLDENGIEEILVHVYPHVNSMPLEEFVVLKVDDSGYRELENTYELNGEADNNPFPVQVLYGEAKNTFEIVVEERKGVEAERFVYDITEHYQLVMDEADPTDSLYILADNILNQDVYHTGDVMGSTAAWGIWSVSVDQVDGVNCLVASHGITGLDGKWDYLGNLDVYFNYDSQGKIHVLRADFVPNEEII